MSYIKCKDLRDQQSADDRDDERPSELQAGADVNHEWKCAQHGSESRHQNRLNGEEKFMDGPRVGGHVTRA